MSKTKLILLDGVKCSPEVLLHQALERVDEMEGVVVLMLLKDGQKSVDYMCSNMKLSDLVFAERVLGLHVEDSLRESEGGEEDGGEQPTG